MYERLSSAFLFFYRNNFASSVVTLWVYPGIFFLLYELVFTVAVWWSPSLVVKAHYNNKVSLVYRPYY